MTICCGCRHLLPVRVRYMKRQVMGREVVIAVTNGKLDFGPWEQVFFGEFDGRRAKLVLVEVIGERVG